MTEAERLARAHQAQHALGMIDPMFGNLEAEWTARMVEVANTELHPGKRCDMITALSHALKITKTVRAGLVDLIRDGELAKDSKLRAEKIEKMTAPQRRLLGIAPY